MVTYGARGFRQPGGCGLTNHQPLDHGIRGQHDSSSQDDREQAASEIFQRNHPRNRLSGPIIESLDVYLLDCSPPVVSSQPSVICPLP
jgi:hypothetical protein